MTLTWMTFNMTLTLTHSMTLLLTHNMTQYMTQYMTHNMTLKLNKGNTYQLMTWPVAFIINAWKLTKVFQTIPDILTGGFADKLCFFRATHRVISLRTIRYFCWAAYILVDIILGGRTVSVTIGIENERVETSIGRVIQYLNRVFLHTKL